MNRSSEATFNRGQCRIPELICKSSYFYLCVRLGDFSKRNRGTEGWLHFFFYLSQGREGSILLFTIFWGFFSINISF